MRWGEREREIKLSQGGGKGSLGPLLTLCVRFTRRSTQIAHMFSVIGEGGLLDPIIVSNPICLAVKINFHRLSPVRYKTYILLDLHIYPIFSNY